LALTAMSEDKKKGGGLAWGPNGTTSRSLSRVALRAPGRAAGFAPDSLRATWRGTLGQSRPRSRITHMNSLINIPATTISARRVPDDARMKILPRHFGKHMMVFENSTYDFMQQLCERYKGGYWHYFELSNGGFYMAPNENTMYLCVDGNGFSGEMSADAAGITVCLFAYSHLSFRYTGKIFARHYHRLRDFAMDHTEAGLIAAAID
jgi:hypothetical protein